MAAAWALWAASDSKTHGLKRFERVFPLEPRALFFTVLLVWPIALPWYFRLKDKALLGLLTEPRGPSRTKYVLLAFVLLGALVTIGASLAFRASPTFRALAHVQQAVQTATQDPIRVTLTSDATLTLSIVNSTLVASDHVGREAMGRRLAAIAAENLGTLSSVREIRVEFLSYHATAGLQVTRSEDSFRWPTDLLTRGAPNPP
jgi:hypothetical protein